MSTGWIGIGSHPQGSIPKSWPTYQKTGSSNIDELVKAFQGMDTIIHLAGDPNADATWESLRKNNIEGTYNVFEAAKRTGARRVIFASSIHVAHLYTGLVQQVKKRMRQWGTLLIIHMIK